MAILEGSDHRFTVANQAFEELVNRADLVGKSLAEAVPEMAEQGLVELLDEAKRSGDPFVGRAMSLRIDLPGGWCEEIFVDLMLQPLRDAGGGVPGVFVQGHNVSEDKKSEELRSAHNRVLELAIGDSPLEQTLGELIKIVEFDVPNRGAGIHPAARSRRQTSSPWRGTKLATRISGGDRRLKRSGRVPDPAERPPIGRSPYSSQTSPRIRFGRSIRQSRCRMAFAPAGRFRSSPVAARY